MSNTKVLIVEDETIVAMDIKNRLENLKYIVTATAFSGEDAIKLTAETCPDIVLTDIMLDKNMDGVEVAEKIRELFGIPVIYLTAYADEKTLSRAKLTKPFGYILKPFEEMELHAAIEIAIYNHDLERELKESKKWLHAALNSIGDAVIATDKEGIIKLINPFAQAITGWKEEDAFDKPLGTIFNVINGDAGEKAEDPRIKVIREGIFYGLASNTILIRNDGKEIPVDIIGSTIKDDRENIIGLIFTFYDITERKRSGREKDKFLKAFASCTDGITIADENDRFIYVNEAYAGIFGYHQEELIGNTWHKITLPELIAPTEKGLSNTLHNMEVGTFYGEVSGLKKDGMIIPTEVRGKGIWDENGNYQGHICIVRDITERKQADEAMKKYAIELEEANQLKDLFTDIIRHDLLNPVTVIRGLSEILLENESLPENRKSIENIIKNVGKLEEMIQSTATLAKVEALDKLNFEERNLCEILRTVISDFTPMIRNKGMSVEFLGEGKCIAEVNPYIEEVFSNLLSNAVKYSPENTSITVGIKAVGEDWIVSVKDHGNRIPDEYKEIIFERFKRIEKRGVKGTGLGLSIVKRIVDIHKGKVHVEDNPEGGNIFLVTIPAKRSE